MEQRRVDALATRVYQPPAAQQLGQHNLGQHIQQLLANGGGGGAQPRWRHVDIHRLVADAQPRHFRLNPQHHFRPLLTETLLGGGPPPKPLIYPGLFHQPDVAPLGGGIHHAAPAGCCNCSKWWLLLIPVGAIAIWYGVRVLNARESSLSPLF